MDDAPAPRPAEGPAPARHEVEKNLLVQTAINSVLRVSLEPISLHEQMHRILGLILNLPWLALEAKGCIFLAEEGAKVLAMRAQIGMPAGAVAVCSRVPFGQCLCGRSIAAGEVVFADRVDARHDAHYPGMAPHGHYCVPIASGQRPIGLLNLYVQEGHLRSPEEERFLRAVADVLAGVIERKRSEMAVRESEARKAAILEMALDCIITIDDTGRIVEFNPAAEKTFGFRRAEVLGQPMAERIIPPSLREQHYRGFAHCLATGEGRALLNRRVEMPALRADGTEFPVELAITRIPTDGPPLFTAYLRDITVRRALERRRTARLALAQVLAEAATIQEAAPRILQAVCEGLGWAVGTFWDLDRAAGVLRCVETWHSPSAEALAALWRQQTFPPGVGLPGRIWGSGRPAWVADVSQDATGPSALVAAAEGPRGAVGCPVRLGREMAGVMVFFGHEVRGPDEDLLEMMASFAAQTEQFLERRQAERRLAAEHAVSQVLAVSSTLSEATPAILRAICESLDWDVGVVWEVDRDAGVLRCVE
jgi:PAS domain S-box-containing protein